MILQKRLKPSRQTQELAKMVLGERDEEISGEILGEGTEWEIAAASLHNYIFHNSENYHE